MTEPMLCLRKLVAELELKSQSLYLLKYTQLVFEVPFVNLISFNSPKSMRLYHSSHLQMRKRGSERLVICPNSHIGKQKIQDLNPSLTGSNSNVYFSNVHSPDPDTQTHSQAGPVSQTLTPHSWDFCSQRSFFPQPPAPSLEHYFCPKCRRRGERGAVMVHELKSRRA